jgi:alpha-tubulin suppressor-like RCC1 family protein
MTYNFSFDGTDVDDAPPWITKAYMIEMHPYLVQGLPALCSWGANNYGQLGDGTTTNRSLAVQTVASGTNWQQLSCGMYHVGGVKLDGTLWLWGWNANGQLGDNTIANKSSPVQTIAGGTNWKQVSCGMGHTAAIKTDGTLWTWGWGPHGQLGDNTSTSKSSPVQTVAGGSNWSSVSCGTNSTGAIKTDGTLWMCGYNGTGMLGLGHTSNVSSPVQTVAGGTNWKQVALSGAHMLGVKTDGTLWTCGWNTSGELGDNTQTAKSSPVQTVAGGNNWNSVSCSYALSAAIKQDGTLWTWGGNSVGQLGDGTTSPKSSPIQTIAAGYTWKYVSCGATRIGAIKTDSTLWMWGSNNVGQLDTGDTSNRTSPTLSIEVLNRWKRISCGGDTSVGMIEYSGDF